MILDNGTVRTMDPALPTARALAIAGERVVGGIGAHETSLPSPDRVNLNGRCVVPGFTDSHVHFPTWALAQHELQLEESRSLDDVLAHVTRAVRASAGGWIRGYGWRQDDWPEGSEPSRLDLDRVTGDIPTALMAKDHHSLWLNSAALARADDDLDRPGGVVEVDDHGEPTGILREKSAWHFRDRYLRPSSEEMVEAARAGVKIANSRGVTAVHDNDGPLGALSVWQRLRAEESLTMRVWQSLPPEQIDQLAALGIASGFGDSFVRIGCIKVFMDGTLGSRTARMLDGSGVEITSRPALADIIRRAAQAGLPVAVHAIGDLANRDALDAFGETEALWRPQGLRHRIEHAQFLAPEDIPRFAQLGIAASVQFSHAPSDRDLADRYVGRDVSGAYAYRSLRHAGALLANGSDAPIEELDPLLGIRAGVLRSLDERDPWHPEEALSVEEALVATTVNPAWLDADELRRGKLIPGQLADLVVLNRDPVTCPADGLAKIEVVATMVGGRWVHNPPPWD